MKPIKGLRTPPPAAHDPSRKVSKVEARRAVRRAGERELQADLAQLAEQGDTTSQFFLGLMYAYSDNAAKAVKWYTIAAKKGNVAAQVNLGFMYEIGEGVAKNAAKAVKWYAIAAKQGNARAQYNLGWMYANGEGVRKNAAKVVKWYTMAAKQGHLLAQNYLGNMYANANADD